MRLEQINNTIKGRFEVFPDKRNNPFLALWSESGKPSMGG
jgi:hypothetical protein